MLGATLAAPQVTGESAETTTTPRPHVAILKQINQLNPDGSYTYGFEAADGSFRVETRDIKGNVKGKFGYVDEFGEVKTVDYAAGSGAGFNPQGLHIPVPLVPVRSPSGNTDDEFGTDEDWQSVDADEDGIPDPPRPLSQRIAPIQPAAAAQFRGSLFQQQPVSPQFFAHQPIQQHFSNQQPLFRTNPPIPQQ